MVVHAFPAAKLAALLIKQISKPIANSIKQGAKSSPVFRKYVCLPPARFYNWCEVKAKMWLLHLGQPVNITVLNEAASIELGANLLGESIIFIIAAGVLVLEYNRSSRKEAAKEEARKKEIEDLQIALRDLFIQTEEQGAHIRELTRKIGDLETGIQTTNTPKNKPPETGPSEEPPEIKPRSKSTVVQKQKSQETMAELLDLLEDVMESSKHKCDEGVIFRAVSDVKNTFFIDCNRQREPGIITVALNHLYKDVYRKPLSF